MVPGSTCFIELNNFQLLFGPYFAFGVAGKYWWDYKSENNGHENEYNGEIKLIPVFGHVSNSDLENDEKAFNAFDFGLNLGIGYRAGPILMNLGYSIGISNVTPDYDDEHKYEYKVFNRVIFLTVSYVFKNNQ